MHGSEVEGPTKVVGVGVDVAPIARVIAGWTGRGGDQSCRG